MTPIFRHLDRFRDEIARVSRKLGYPLTLYISLDRKNIWAVDTGHAKGGGAFRRRVRKICAACSQPGDIYGRSPNHAGLGAGIRYVFKRRPSHACVSGLGMGRGGRRPVGQNSGDNGCKRPNQYNRERKRRGFFGRCPSRHRLPADVQDIFPA